MICSIIAPFSIYPVHAEYIENGGIEHIILIRLKYQEK